MFVPEWQQSMITVRFTPALEGVQFLAQPVIQERVLPVQIGRAEDLIALIRLVAVVVGYVGPVARVMEQERITGVGPGEQFVDARLHGLLGGVVIGKDRDVTLHEAVIVRQDRGEVFNVVNTAAEVSSGDAIAVDTDE